MGRSRFADLSAKIFVVDWESLKDNKCKKKKKINLLFAFLTLYTTCSALVNSDYNTSVF